MDLNDVTDAILGSALRAHRRFGPGLLESLYEGFLAHDLERRGLRVARQHLIRASFDGVGLHDAFRADLLVESCVIVEIKSLERTAAVHSRQLLSYLRLTNLQVGLLLNFGAELMKDGIKRVVNDYSASTTRFLRIDDPTAAATQSEMLPGRTEVHESKTEGFVNITRPMN